MFCENCGTQIADDSKVCEECGYVIDPGHLKNGEDKAAGPQKQAFAMPWKKVNKKIAGIVAGAVAVIVILVVFLLPVLSSFGDKSAPLLYLKKDGLYAMKAGAEAPYLISEEAYVYNGYYQEGFYLSEDGSEMFFLDNYDEGNQTADLYLRNPKEEEPKEKDADEKGKRIASNISVTDGAAFQIAEGGKYILYYKDYTYEDGGKLYFNDLDQEVKIDSDVSSYSLGDGVVFYDKYDSEASESTLYECALEENAEKSKIGSDISNYIVTGKTVYYYTYDSDSEDVSSDLYVKEFGKDKVKIDKGAINGTYLTDDGVFYYGKMSEDGGTLYDYVSDSMLDQDKNMTEPDISDYQTESTSGWYWYYPSYETDYDGYYAARDAYYEKQERDSLREYLQNSAPYENMCSIYRYDGGEPVLECSTAVNVNMVWGSGKGRGLSYIKKNMDNSEPVADLSELLDEQDIYNYLDEGTTADLCVLIDGGKESVVQSGTEIESYDIYLYGNTLACLDFSEKNLYIAKVDNGAVAGFESLDYDVDSLSYDLGEGSFFYYKDADNSHADFYGYKDGKSGKLATDVYVGSVWFLDDPSEFIYLADYNSERGEGTAYLVKGGDDKTRLADDVYNIFYVNGDIYFLQDYDMDDGEGDLRKYVKEGETELIDEDVIHVIV